MAPPKATRPVTSQPHLSEAGRKAGDLVAIKVLGAAD
jgi:hypothetical protein